MNDGWHEQESVRMIAHSCENVPGHMWNKGREFQGPSDQAVEPLRRTHQHTLSVHDMVDVANQISQNKPVRPRERGERWERKRGERGRKEREGDRDRENKLCTAI